jgi:hypothetical protein
MPITHTLSGNVENHLFEIVSVRITMNYFLGVTKQHEFMGIISIFSPFLAILNNYFFSKINPPVNESGICGAQSPLFCSKQSACNQRSSLGTPLFWVFEPN